MIYTYGVSMAGTYHIKQNIVCQDYFKIMKIDKNLVVAAVADGLGSAEFSDIGSNIAASVATEHCRNHINIKTPTHEIPGIIRTAFAAAQTAIEHAAKNESRQLEKYDTTLSLAVLVHDTLYYGHSGDSGMIALTARGRFEQVTTQQRDEEGRVFPLFFTEKWIFGQYPEKVASVLLATDGMLETFFPFYIRNEPVKIHVALAQFYMDNIKIHIEKHGEEAVRSHMEKIIQSIPDTQVSDDKTIAVLINPSVKVKRQQKAYYQEPDWAELKRKHDEEWRKLAYPGLR